MSKLIINLLGAISIAMICLTCLAAEQNMEPTKKFMGKWDSHAGIISFFVQNLNGDKQARMLVVDENIETQSSKMTIDMDPEALDDFEDLVLVTLKLMGNPDELPIPPLGTKEAQKNVGTLIYPNARVSLFIVDPAGTQRYVSLVIKTLDAKTQHVFWMEKEDLVSLKKLLDKVLKELGTV